MLDYANIAVPMGICLIGLSLFLAYIGISHKSNTPIIIKKRIYKGLFFTYIAWMILYLLVPSNFWLQFWYNVRGWESSGIDVSEIFSGSFNVVPIIFRDIFGEATYGGWTYKMLLSNIVLFIPFGMLVPSILKKSSYRKVLIIGAMFSSIIEMLQPIVGRSFDVDDIIMRVIGTAIGGFFFLILKNHCKGNI